MEYPAKSIEDVVEELSKLPGIGKKTALRLTLNLLKRGEESTLRLGHALQKLHIDTKYCSICHNISDHEICSICSSQKRDKSLICVVENFRDVIAIENTGQFFGVYHVLGGVIDPMNGIGPDDINAYSLILRTQNSEIREVIFALSANMEGDTTTFYLTRKIKRNNLTITSIARGIPVGGELEFADEITLGRSLTNRTFYSIQSDVS